jgi:hydroxymethylpyrimidine pyrophosphatase-like HAD family hydrolase
MGGQMKVDIKSNGHKGTIVYDPKKKSLKVKLADIKKRERIINYLKKPQVFRIATSSKDNEYRVDLCKPIKSQMYLELALNQIYGDLKISILWDTLKES